MRSPTQQPRFPSYSPSSRDRPYSGNDAAYQHPPQTPPNFPPPSSLTRSPRYGRAPSPMNNTLPPLNGNTANPDHSSGYHPHSASNTSAYSLPRPYNSSMMSGTAHSPSPGLFNRATTPHGHQSNVNDIISHSPQRDHEAHDVRSNNGAYGVQSSAMREARPPSQRESVRKKKLKIKIK